MHLGGGFLPVLRLARILRVLRLITAIPKLQLLVTCLLKSLPSMFYVSILLFLLFYVYGAMAVFLLEIMTQSIFETYKLPYSRFFGWSRWRIGQM